MGLKEAFKEGRSIQGGISPFGFKAYTDGSLRYLRREEAFKEVIFEFKEVFKGTSRIEEGILFFRFKNALPL